MNRQSYLPHPVVRRWVAGVLAVGVALLAWSLEARADISQRDAAAMSQASLIYIATVRKDGNQSTAAPVWFTPGADNNSILIQTGPDTWKAKRIRRGSPVIVWIGAANGPAFIGKAEITMDGAAVDKILTDYPKKYGMMDSVVGPSRGNFESGDRIAIRITPIKDLPADFSSAPGTPAPKL